MASPSMKSQSSKTSYLFSTQLVAYLQESLLDLTSLHMAVYSTQRNLSGCYHDRITSSHRSRCFYYTSCSCIGVSCSCLVLSFSESVFTVLHFEFQATASLHRLRIPTISLLVRTYWHIICSVFLLESSLCRVASSLPCLAS